MKQHSLFAIGLVASLVAGVACGAEERVLRIGTEAGYPPFEYRDPSGAIKGFDIDFGNAVCARMNVKCSWVVQDFDGLIPSLEAGKIDMIISSLSVTAERKKAIDFTKPYYETLTQLVAAKGSGLTDAPASLKGKTIGVQSGTVQQTFVEQRLPDSADKAYDTLESANLDLESGRVDAVLADKLASFDWLKKEGTAKGFDYVGKPIDDPLFAGDVAIGVRKGDADLAAKLNTAIDAVLDSSDYDRLNAQYFPFSIRPK